MSVPTFHPLDQLRVIRDDPNLTGTQRLILMCAVLRTDNTTRRVRVSQQILADDAHVSRASATRAFRAPEVRRYFLREREGRQLNLTWRVLSCVTMTHDMRHHDSNMRHHDAPSALICPSSASTSTLEDTSLVRATGGMDTREDGFWDDAMGSGRYWDEKIDGPVDLCPNCRWFVESCTCNEQYGAGTTTPPQTSVDPPSEGETP